MHQLSECLPTLPIAKKADNTLHPHLEQVRVRFRVMVRVRADNTLHSHLEQEFKTDS